MPEVHPSLDKITQAHNEGNLCQLGRWLHHAARMGYLDKVSDEIKTAQNLLIAEGHGVNSFHLACSHGHMNQIPLSLQTFENFKVPTNAGWTSYHWAAHRGYLHQMRKEAMPESVWDLKAGESGLTVCQVVFQVLKRHPRSLRQLQVAFGVVLEPPPQASDALGSRPTGTPGVVAAEGPAKNVLRWPDF